MAGQRGQMVVELAIALPVLLMALVIGIDTSIYLGECAKFQNLAPQAVLSCAASPEGGVFNEEDSAVLVRVTLAGQFHKEYEQVKVSTQEAGTGLVRYDCTLEVTPWPFASGTSESFMGLQIPLHLTRTVSFVASPYKAGVL